MTEAEKDNIVEQAIIFNNFFVSAFKEKLLEGGNIPAVSDWDLLTVAHKQFVGALETTKDFVLNLWKDKTPEPDISEGPTHLTSDHPLKSTWFADRMMRDHWAFGALLTSGKIIHFINIQSVSDDGQWLTVELAKDDDMIERDALKKDILYLSCGERTTMDINTDHIIGLFELCST